MTNGCSHVLDYNGLEDPFENFIQLFQYHQSISAIKRYISESMFNFDTVTTEDFVREISKLDPKNRLQE